MYIHTPRNRILSGESRKIKNKYSINVYVALLLHNLLCEKKNNYF